MSNSGHLKHSRLLSCREFPRISFRRYRLHSLSPKCRKTRRAAPDTRLSRRLSLLRYPKDSAIPRSSRCLCLSGMSLPKQSLTWSFAQHSVSNSEQLAHFRPLSYLEFPRISFRRYRLRSLFRKCHKTLRAALCRRLSRRLSLLRYPKATAIPQRSRYLCLSGMSLPKQSLTKDFARRFVSNSEQLAHFRPLFYLEFPRISFRRYRLHSLSPKCRKTRRAAPDTRLSRRLWLHRYPKAFEAPPPRRCLCLSERFPRFPKRSSRSSQSLVPSAPRRSSLCERPQGRCFVCPQAPLLRKAAHEFSR